jgi:conjugative transfer region lipoprotein (TIGR03751 family)
MPTLKTALILIWISQLAGCAFGGKDTILPQDGPTMKEVYDHHFMGGGAAAPESGAPDTSETSDTEETSETKEPKQNSRFGLTGNIKQSRLRDDDKQPQLDSYTRSSLTEIKNFFPRLKNKTLVMYVFPHLGSRERNPVPGYSTAFTFYEKTEYALPGEIAEGY